MEQESKKKEPKKIQLIFTNKTITTQLHISLGFEQKLRKAMKFCRDKFQIKPCAVARFFHQNKELFEEDTPEKSGLVNNDTIDVLIHDSNIGTNIVVKTEPNEEEENQIPTPTQPNNENNHIPNGPNMEGNQTPVEPNKEKNNTPINESNQDHQQPDSNLSDISATTDDPPTEEPPTTDQMNTKTDDAAQATCDESIAPIDSIQNVVQEFAPNDNQQFDDSVVKDQSESIPESTHETESHSLSSATHLDQVDTPNAESNVMTDKNSKRNRQDVGDFTEPCAKVMKMLDTDTYDSDKCVNMIESLLNDLADLSTFAIDPVKPMAEKHDSQIKREPIDIEAEIERRVAIKIAEMQQTHRDELAEQQKKIMQQAAAQLDELKQTHTAEIEKWKQNYGSLSEKYADLVTKQESNMLAQQQALAMQNEADKNELKMLYEGRLSGLQNKYVELEKIAEKQKTDIAARDSSIAMYKQELQNAQSTIANYKKHYDVLKSNYDTLSKRDGYYSQQNSMLQNYNTQYQGQLKAWEGKYNALKQDLEKKMVDIQKERNRFLISWKDQEKRCHDLTRQMGLMKQQSDDCISKMRQEILMKLQNQVTVPTPTSSPVSTHQPPESTLTPPPMPNTPRERKCELCGKQCKMSVTIPLHWDCKFEYFKQQYEQLKPKQADI